MKRIWTRAAAAAMLCAALLSGCAFAGEIASDRAPADPLTGQELQYPGQRTAAVVIDNIGTVQWGIGSASAVLEAQTEADAPASLCLVYPAVSAMPTVGPVTLGQDLYWRLLSGQQVIPVQRGGGQFARNYLDYYNIRAVDALEVGQNAFSCDSSWSNAPLWRTSGAQVQGVLDSLNISSQLDELAAASSGAASENADSGTVTAALPALLPQRAEPRLPEPQSEEAVQAQVHFGTQSTTAFAYDETSGTYGMLRADGTPQTDANTGTQAQWDAVRIDTSYGDPFKNAAVHVDAEQHVFGAWQTVEQPGCEQPGTISRTCTNGCGLKQTAAVPALGHDWDEGVVTTKPDGVLCGILHVTCKRCGAESDELLMPEIWAYEQFGDVDPTLWSYEGIQFCVMMGYMSGMDTHVFAPRGVTTRAQLVQILYNFVGGPEVSGETPFTDLTANWYKDAVLWAYQTGVTSGTSETTFAPNDPVTREQVAVLLYEFADKVLEIGGAETPADLSQFPDGDQVSSWAREAMADAVALGIINGTKVENQVFLAPQGSVTRDQIATMFEGFCASLA